MIIAKKTCLVTGCSSGGVGCALAEAFKNKGYHVFATARSPSKIPKTLHEASNVTIITLDTTSSESISAAAAKVRKETGGMLDILINNAGVGLDMPVLDTPMAEAHRVLDSNFFGVLEMIQVFSPMLIKAGGCIVNNSSVGGRCPLPFLGIYQASKAALIQMSEVLRLEMAPLGVRVLTLLTGGATTNFLANLPSLVLPEESYYQSVRHIIAKQPENVPYGVTPQKFAEDVLRQVEKGTAGQLWIGGGASMARLAMWLLPQWMIDQFSLSQKPFAKKLAQEHKKRIGMDTNTSLVG